MDKETLSIVLSVAGLLLGLLSAHAQLRAMASWAVKAGGDKARAWIDRMHREAELYAANSSALISFLVQQTLAALFVFSLLVGLLGILKGGFIASPNWVRQALMLAYAVWVGNKLADVSNIVDLTLREARKNHRTDG